MQIFIILIHIFCRYDDLRSELERERMQSDRFQVEIAELQRQFALELQDKERHFRNKEKVRKI